MVRLSLAPLAALLLAAGPLACTALHLSPLSLSVTSSTGSTALAESLVHPRSLSEPVALEPQGALKLAFEVLDKEGGKGTSPHQAGLSFVECVSSHGSISANWRARRQADKLTRDDVPLCRSVSSQAKTSSSL